MKTLDLNEAAEFLKCSETTVRSLVEEGLPGAKVGRAWVFVDVDLVDWLRTQYAACRYTKGKTHRTGTTHLTSMGRTIADPQNAQASGKQKRSKTKLEQLLEKETLADLL